MTLLTRDSFYHGSVTVYQHSRGYRFSIDAPVLASFLEPHPGEQALEIGCGTGVIALLALYRNRYRSVIGLEIQRELADLARRNARENGMEGRLIVQQGDINREFHRFKGVPHIFSNPPYLRLGRGRISRNRQVRTAKFETALRLHEIFDRASRILPESGTLSLILPADREEEMKNSAGAHGLCLTRHREVRSFEHGKAERILIQLSTGRDRLISQPPLIIFKTAGVYSDEMKAVFSGNH